MPGLTITTDIQPRTAAHRRTSATSGRESPSRPDISPITPTLEPAQLPTQPTPTTGSSTMPDFARDRPILMHTTQSDQVGVEPPPAQPVDFESNPDVLALKSAISILQLQRARATADIRSLSQARDAALANPEAFTADLVAGRVRVEGDPLFSGTRANDGAAEDKSDSSDSSESDSDDEGEQEEKENGSARQQQVTPESESKVGDDTPSTNGTAAAPLPDRQQKGKRRPKQGKSQPPWQKLPRPQNVVRCPPINWAQYGVVGESLDKLHAEQVAAPAPSAPMVLGPGGTYEFKAGGSPADQGRAIAPGGEQPRRLVGVAAPYNPLRDKLDKKGKGGKR
ncbi:hypothetical protein VTI28DRAFT_416 [Corynascus sepedonium]